MRIDILKYMQSLIYYSAKLAKLTPNALNRKKVLIREIQT